MVPTDFFPSLCGALLRLQRLEDAFVSLATPTGQIEE